jgi:protein-tyrosine phosphatase
MNAIERLRRLPFEGAVNFRDIGGYAGAGGRTLRWGQIYRSDSLSALTPADLDRLSALGLRLVCDLRLPFERSAKPDRLPEVDPPEMLHIGFLTRGTVEMLQAIAAGRLGGAEVDEALRRHYRLFARDHNAEFRAILDRLIEPDRRPAVIHCTSGKDRTGFAIALVLLALGVSEETALEDYALTNHYRRDIVDVVGSGVDAAVMQILTSANPMYLKEGLDSARELYGSIEAYLAKGLALAEERLERFRRDMLEEDTP